MTPREAVAELRTAIASVRAACGADPSCRNLLSTLSKAEDELREVNYSNEPDHGLDHREQLQSSLATAKDAVDKMFGDKDDTPPSNLKQAAEVTRQVFAERRKGAPKPSKEGYKTPQ